MSADNVSVVIAHTDALTDRVEAWLSIALTKAKVRPVPDTDLYTATLPPFRKFCGSGIMEGIALGELRVKLHEWAKGELIAGRELPTWESAIPEITPAMKCLVRLSNLRHELKTRAAEWGGERRNLPAGAVERCLVEMDAVVTRHAMQMNGSPPPAEINP
jgi:hypothetical protein